VSSPSAAQSRDSTYCRTVAMKTGLRYHVGFDPHVNGCVSYSGPNIDKRVFLGVVDSTSVHSTDLCRGRSRASMSDALLFVSQRCGHPFCQHLLCVHLLDRRPALTPSARRSAGFRFPDRSSWFGLDAVLRQPRNRFLELRLMSSALLTHILSSFALVLRYSASLFFGTARVKSLGMI